MGEKIKSAAELAMEKANKLNTSKNENIPDETDQYIKAAKTLAENIVQGKTEALKVQESLNNYPDEVIPQVTRAMLDIFCHGINLDNSSQVLRAISYLRKDETTQQALEEAKRLYRKYYHLQKKQLEELQQNAQQQLLKQLRKEGISGSAIYKVKAMEPQAETQIKERIDQEYRQNLSGFLTFLQQD